MTTDDDTRPKPKPRRGDIATCSQCEGPIVYLDPAWKHIDVRGATPRHIALPMEYDHEQP